MRKAYEEYKATSIQWLPKIPRHWDLSFLSQIATEKKVKKPKSAMFPVMSLSYGRIIKKKNINSGLVPNNYDNYQIISRGDIILRFTDLQNDHTSLRTGLVMEKGIITSAYTNIKPRTNSSFLAYLLHTYDTLKIFYGLGGGVRQSIGFKDVRYLQLPIPPREEQKKIVRFLDWKVSSINKLISIKQQEITELMELKKATISDAVTHGLDETTPMKDSGISWLGSIPQHWKTETLKRVSTLRKQKSYYNKNKDIFIGLENLKGYSNTLQETSTQYESSIQCVCKKGDLLFGKLRPYLSKVIICPKDCFCTNELLVVSFFNGNIKFLMYVFLHESFIDSVNASTYGAKMPRANDQYVLNMCIPVPPRNEQDHIVCFLDARCTEIDRLIAAKQAQITNLHDLKSILIADVVTGQIDVRDVTIPNYETVHEHADEAPDTIANSLEAAEEV